MTPEDTRAHQVEVRLGVRCRYAMTEANTVDNLWTLFVGVCLYRDCDRRVCPDCGVPAKSPGRRDIPCFVCWECAPKDRE